MHPRTRPPDPSPAIGDCTSLYWVGRDPLGELRREVWWKEPRRGKPPSVLQVGQQVSNSTSECGRREGEVKGAEPWQAPVCVAGGAAERKDQ